MNTQPRRRPNLALGGSLVLGLCLVSCGDESPSAPTITVGAPGIVSPADGAQVLGEVTLTVSNATVTGGSGPARYTFQIATDSGFTNLAAQANDLPEGAGGQTSWTVGSEVAVRRVLLASPGDGWHDPGSVLRGRPGQLPRRNHHRRQQRPGASLSIPSPTARR